MTDSKSGTDELSHRDLEQHMSEKQEWPQFFVSGDEVESEDFTPAYFKVEGPNGPVSCRNPGIEAFPVTMYSFAMEAQADSFRLIPKEKTPWGDSK